MRLECISNCLSTVVFVRLKKQWATHSTSLRATLLKYYAGQPL